MAATVSHIADSVMGNQRVEKLKVTFGANSATADVQTNLSAVSYAMVQPLEGAAMPSSRINSGVAGTATAGLLALHSGTSAASYLVVAYGPNGVE